MFLYRCHFLRLPMMSSIRFELSTFRSLTEAEITRSCIDLSSSSSFLIFIITIKSGKPNKKMLKLLNILTLIISSVLKDFSYFAICAAIKCIIIRYSGPSDKLQLRVCFSFSEIYRQSQISWSHYCIEIHELSMMATVS